MKSLKFFAVLLRLRARKHYHDVRTYDDICRGQAMIKTGIQLRYLSVTNFKALDSFEIEFPEPSFQDDASVLVFGSKNGLGKTSLLESCALLFLSALLWANRSFSLSRYLGMPVNLADLLIRAGTGMCELKGCFQEGSKVMDVHVRISKEKNGRAVIETKTAGDLRPFRLLRHPSFYAYPSIYHSSGIAERFLFTLVGASSEPLFVPGLIYFHSYRKVQEGNPNLGMMVDEERRWYRRSRLRPEYEYPVSAFKLVILRAMMSKAGLFEGLEKKSEADETLSKLNDLVQRYTGGKIEKLRSSSDSTIDFRITTAEGDSSFTFDGLSSGQKEIISTLFLIWYYSRRAPCIVLIDEPELHLNAEWHIDFISKITELSPRNQYIISTHSEDIFSSVSADRRVLLEMEG